MSARAVMGLAPSGRPHPATKWSLLMALLVVVVLGVPSLASAGTPTVQAPTGPQSGGVFTGTYTFDTYISCSSGLSFNSSYSNNLEGTHTFAFYGAADGSLLVKIDGGGMQLITSCGDPLTPPHTNVANYTVTKYSTPPPPPPTPSPTPSATPTPTPSPTPTLTPASGGGGGSGGNLSSPPPSPQAGQTPPADTPPPPPTSSPTPSATPTPTPSPTVGPTPVHPQPPHYLAWVMAGLSLLTLLLLVLASRSRRLHEWLRSRLAITGLRLEPYWFKLRHALSRRVQLHGRDLLKRRGLAHHHHSGKLLAHHHTSYPALAFLLLVSAVLAAAMSYSTRADSSYLSLTVLGPPPATGATINQPTFGQHFSTANQTVRGTCPSGLFVEIWRGGAFAGTTTCDVNGLYQLLVTLTPDQNDLTARVADALGQYGPDSAILTVYYDVPLPPTPSPTPSVQPSPPPSPPPPPTKSPGKTPRSTPKPPPNPGPPPLLLSSSRHYQGADVGTPVEWIIAASGGQKPYHITWEWGDGRSDTTYAEQAGDIKFEHRYTKPGIYQAIFRAKDTAGHEAVIELVVVINGAGTPATTSANPFDQGGSLVYVWPLLGIAGLVVLSFWLGERHKLAATPLHSIIPTST